MTPLLPQLLLYALATTYETASSQDCDPFGTNVSFQAECQMFRKCQRYQVELIQQLDFDPCKSVHVCSASYCWFLQATLCLVFVTVQKPLEK